MDYLVVYIVWEDVVVYVEWVGKCLLIEVEWEWVVMGGQEDVKYLWGNMFISEVIDKVNFW